MRLALLAPGFAIAAFTATACGQVATMTLPEGTTVIRDVAYVSEGHERQVLDLYLPGASARPLPLVLVVHGGAWMGGDKAMNLQVAWAVPLLVAAGYAVASVNHRYSQHALFPAQIHDLKAALRFLRANADRHGTDAERVGAWGESSGGHLAALLGTSAGVPELDGDLGLPGIATRVRAVVVWYGPTDFLQMDEHRIPGGMVHDAADSPESQLIGGPIRDLPERVRFANPASYATPDDPPFLLFHGDRDPLVPHHQSLILRDALAAAGVAVTLRTLPGAGHGTPEFRGAEVGRAMIEFFDRNVKAPRDRAVPSSH